MSKKSRRKDSYTPPKDIEVSNKHLGLRIAAVVILIMVAATSFIYGFNQLFSTTEGWQEVEADEDNLSCASELTFMYNIGGGSESATTERKALVLLYSDACETAFELFHVNMEFDGVNNVYYINNHPNEEITVDEVLYSALETMVESGGRELYLAPIYYEYQGIFFSSEDWEAEQYDPYLNEAQAEYFSEVIEFASEDEHVYIELLGDNKIILHVSDEYLSFAEENGIDRFIDFSWMTNAFIVDYISDIMIENGYTQGMIASYDGFARNLGGYDVAFSYTLYSRQGSTVYSVADMIYDGAKSFVFVHDYAIESLDSQHYYSYESGDTRNPYIDANDGLCKVATADLVLYSESSTCTQLMLEIIDTYISDGLDESKLESLADDGIYSVYYDGYTIMHTEEDILLSSVAEEFSVE
ncbi:MAG: hypothetical protein LUE20_07520 [Oscillospiraceae bacterium]|nr:hypothetical protein [Oscillospiraceae bacterium]